MLLKLAVLLASIISKIHYTMAYLRAAILNVIGPFVMVYHWSDGEFDNITLESRMGFYNKEGIYMKKIFGTNSTSIVIYNGYPSDRIFVNSVCLDLDTRMHTITFINDGVNIAVDKTKINQYITDPVFFPEKIVKLNIIMKALNYTCTHVKVENIDITAGRYESNTYEINKVDAYILYQNPEPMINWRESLLAS